MCINHYKAVNAGLGRNNSPLSLISAQTFHMEVKQQLKHPEGETWCKLQLSAIQKGSSTFQQDIKYSS